MSTTAKQQDVVVYDGSCGFCRKQVDRIRRWDRQGVFDFMPRQAQDALDRYPQLAREEMNTGMRLITPDGTVHVGADAVYRIARRLPKVRYLAWLYRVPLLHGLFRATYGWIAANRQRLSKPCGDDECDVNKP